MKRINKSSVLSLFCAFVMLLSLCLIPGVKSEAAAKAPAIDKSIVMFRNSYNRTIRIKNMKKGDVITKAVPKGNDYSIVSAYTSDEHYNEILVNTFNSSKSGTTKVLVNVKRGKKTYKLSMKVKVVSFASPIQSAKVGKKNVKTSDQLEQVIILGQGGRRMSARELLEDVIEVRQQIRETAREKRSSEKNYLFDHLDEETAARMERIRLGEEEV